MAWKLHFVVCLTVLHKAVTYNVQPPPFWGWEWPHDEYPQVASSAHKYPMNSQRLQFQPFFVEEAQEYSRSHPDGGRTNVRSIDTNRDRLIASINRRNSHDIPEQVNTYRQQNEGSIERSENASSRVASAGYKYPIRSQRLRSQPFIVEEIQEYSRTNPDQRKTNIRSHDSRMYERSIISGDQRNSQDIPEQVNTYRPQIEERSGNASSKVLHNFLKPIKRRVSGPIDTNKIIFPGPTVSTRRDVNVPNIPDSCKGSTFCEEVPDYPQDAINMLINELGNEAENLPLDKLDRSDTPDINQRVGPTEENLELCESRDKVVYPLAATGPDGQWYTLINRKDNPVQGFRVEICTSAGSNCSDIVYFQTGYSARCKQKFVLRTAAVVVQDGDKLKKVEKQVQLPSCCSCVAKVEIN